jgi:hypothetical protein
VDVSAQKATRLGRMLNWFPNGVKVLFVAFFRGQGFLFSATGVVVTVGVAGVW